MSRTGIGAAYVQRQMAQGRSMASIQQEAASKGYTVGAAAQQMFSGGGGGGGGGGGSAPAPAPARTGIGASYVQREMDKGRSMASIQQEAANKGYTIGSAAQQMFNQGGGGGANYSTAGGGSGLNWLEQYRGPQGGRDSTGFGAAALQRARDAGHSDADIQSAVASGGWNLGTAAQQALGSGGSVQDALKGQRNIWAHYSGSGGGWGSGANTRALQSGLTRSEIRSQLSESGLRIGEEAAKDLNVHAQQTSHRRPAHIRDNQDGYNTRFVLLPRDVRATHLNYDEGDPRRYSTGVYAQGGYSDAAIGNLFRSGEWHEGDKHGTRGTYQDADWDYNIGGGYGVDSERKNTYWDNADREALSRHSDAWRGHDYDGRTTSPTGYLSGRGDLPENTGWTAKHQEGLDEAQRTYDDTFNKEVQEGGGLEDYSIGVNSAEPETDSGIGIEVDATDSVIADDNEPVVKVINSDPDRKPHSGNWNNPLASGSWSGYYSDRFG